MIKLPLMASLREIEIHLSEKYDLTCPDNSLNGIQVARQGKIKKIVTGVDFSLAMIKKTVQAGGDVILVHHGLFWGKVFPLTGRHYDLVASLIKNNLALLALHLPLDVHPEEGNNILLLKKLGLHYKKSFGDHHGLKILVRGDYLTAMSLEDFASKIHSAIGKPISIVSAHKQVQKVGICTGGGHFGLEEAHLNGCDTYVTGDAKHTSFHLAKELGINLVQAGHYNTETLGIKALGESLAKKFKLSHEFIDIPTHL